MLRSGRKKRKGRRRKRRRRIRKGREELWWDFSPRGENEKKRKRESNRHVNR